MKPKQVISNYFSSWWVPATTCLALLAALTIAALLHWRPFAIVSNILFVCLAVVFLGILGAAVWNFTQKRWAIGTANLVLFPLCGAVAVVAMGSLMFASVFGPSDDGFADNLSIPNDIEVAEPQSELDAEPGASEDTFQQSLVAALASPGNNDSTITATATALATLAQSAARILRRYLATSPSWRVFKEHGNVFATRRWIIGSEWRYNLHGYYTRSDIDIWSKSGIPDFQSRFTIGLSRKPWWHGNDDTTRLNAGDLAKVSLSEGNRMHESHCVITAGALVVEVFEQSEAMERRLTKAALAHVEKELASLVAQPTWETIRGILPDSSIRQGEASFVLSNSSQPGIYDSIIWVNPGEPGMLYFKAFEVTKGTPLSIGRLKETSNEWVGWSDDPEELFFSNTHFTIYEGEWGKPYSTRFEVWFTPDSGSPDWKLMEKNFKVEGWQR